MSGVNLYRSAAAHTVTKAARYALGADGIYTSDPAGAYVITGNPFTWSDTNGTRYTINEGARLAPVDYLGLGKDGKRRYKGRSPKEASVYAVGLSSLTAEKKKGKG